MKHPSRDQWAPFVLGESSPETTAALNQHLAECGECRSQIDGWRRTLSRLDSWQIQPSRRSRFSATPILQWAAAAAIVLGIGLALGRSWSSPAPAPAQLEASIKASLEKELLAQVQTRVAAEVNRQAALNQVASSNAIALLEARLREHREAETTELTTQFASLVQEQLAKLQEEHQNDYVSLRKDLETVASVADEQLQDTATKLVLLDLATKKQE